MKKILLIDFDEMHSKISEEILINRGYDVYATTNFSKIMKKIETASIDLIISEIYFQPIDAFQLFEIFKNSKFNGKFVIYTKIEDVSLEIKGLDLGVDAYIHKTTSLELFLKKIEILWRTKEISYQHKITAKADGIEVDKVRRRIYKFGKHVETTRTEFDLILYFLKNKNKLLTRENIIKAVWKINNSDDRRARLIDTYVKKIRAKLEISSIITIRGFGYEWAELDE